MCLFGAAIPPSSLLGMCMLAATASALGSGVHIWVMAHVTCLTQGYQPRNTGMCRQQGTTCTCMLVPYRMYKNIKLEAAEARGDDDAVGDNRAAGATATQNAVAAAVRTHVGGGILGSHMCSASAVCGRWRMACCPPVVRLRNQLSRQQTTLGMKCINAPALHEVCITRLGTATVQGRAASNLAWGLDPRLLVAIKRAVGSAMELAEKEQTAWSGRSPVTVASVVLLAIARLRGVSIAL